MNPVEIEEAVSLLASEPFNADEFPFQFLAAFGNKKTAIDRLRSGNTNQSDIPAGVLQRGKIHMAVCDAGLVNETLTTLRESPKTTSQKAEFILATDGSDFQAEELASGETIACEFADFPDHFGFFLPLAGITTVEQIRESSFDIRATGRLNKLYVTLLQDNPDWAAAERRADMNHFMARLIFCFFAEDTDIFHPTYRFTATVERMSSGGEDNTAEVIRELFRAMNTRHADHESEGIPRWADGFPYVNGELFSGNIDVPYFSRISRSYLVHIGNLDWTKINPDIFGSMIQAVADDEERGSLGMHYTSVPNILKVLNPLFLDDLRAKLEEAGDNSRKLLNLRNRMAKIRVFDPACGSGNFLVIAYKAMREIEAEINRRRGESDRKTNIPLTNFRGIELRDFPAEIARLALIIAEYQSDVLYRGQKEALAEFLPLDSENWITCGNALRLDWLSICPPTGTGAKVRGDDLFETPLDQSEIDFENAGGETYICGNPPFKGARKQTPSQKADLEAVFRGHKHFKDADLVSGWFLKAIEHAAKSNSRFGLVATSSISQGENPTFIWPRAWKSRVEIDFAYRPFKWANNASNNAGVYCVIVGASTRNGREKLLFDSENRQTVKNISPYLIAGENQVVEVRTEPLSIDLGKMVMGSMARDGGNLILSDEREIQDLLSDESGKKYLKPFFGTKELLSGVPRRCIWIERPDDGWEDNPGILERVKRTEEFRLASKAKTTRAYASVPWRFAQATDHGDTSLLIPSVISEDYLAVPFVPFDHKVVMSNSGYVRNDFTWHEFAVALSGMHMVWARAVSGRHGNGLRYTAGLSYHTFPLPKLTEQNKRDLHRCAELILLAREAHFPATIAELYDPHEMPQDLRRAHDENDDVLERIYIGRRFRNDTERLEKLFDLYSKTTAKGKAA